MVRLKDEPSDKMRRCCKHCDALVETRAQKSFKCPRCGKTTRIHHARALKPQTVPHFYKKSLDLFREPDPP
ncbi:unnamed protein product [marine sediment metagenome]|uniref:Uncharacterized protein n=1 Tax=marine sediment metagenome TaxID=412755 RepID=X1EUW3_9ZZZZ